MSDFTPVEMLKNGTDQLQTAIDFLESESIRKALIRCNKDGYGSLDVGLIDVKCTVAAVATVMEREMEKKA